MSFRSKTALLVVTLTLVTMGAAFAGVWYYFVSAQRGQLDRALFAVAQREAAEAAAGQMSFSDAPGPSANAVGPLPKYGVIYSRDGVPLSKTDNFAAAPTLPRLVSFEKCFDLQHEGVALRGVVVGVPNSAMRVLLASPRADIEDDASILAAAMTVAFGVGCAWAALVTFFAATRLTRNYRVVEAVARRVAAGDASARVAFRSRDADLTQLAHDLNSMIERLVGLAAAQDRFVAHAAHELRTPLTALRIELEHALLTSREPAEYEAAVRGALDSGKRLSTLADDLLVVARARADKAHRAETTHLEHCIESAVRDVTPVAALREVHVRVEAAGTIMVQGESRSVIRILRNLLENAVRFSPTGGEVTVHSEIGDAIRVTVSDQGPGIPREHAERIFEPFERLARDDHHEGAGLGLSIARSLARSLGGDVLVDVAAPGATFLVELPAAQAPSIEAPFAHAHPA